MTRQRQWLVVLLWGAAGCFGQQATAVGQDLLVANNTASFNESILRFSVTGECLGNFAQPPSRSGPVGLAFDPTGNLYVANHSNNSIHRYSRTGADLGVFATAGLNMPTGLAFNRLGQLVVCNYGDGSLSFFSPTGTWLARVNTGLLHPLALALDACDNIFVSTPNIGANSGVFASRRQGHCGLCLPPELISIRADWRLIERATCMSPISTAARCAVILQKGLSLIHSPPPDSATRSRWRSMPVAIFTFPIKQAQQSAATRPAGKTWESLPPFLRHSPIPSG